MYFTIYKDTQGQFRWNAKANNHEPIASGESYHNKADCVSAVKMMNGLNNYPIHDKTLDGRNRLAELAFAPTPAPELNKLFTAGLRGAYMTPPATGGLLGSFSNTAPPANSLLSIMAAGLPRK